MNKDVLCTSAEREFLEPLDAIVKGTVPSWLNGSLYRNGAAKFEVGEDKYNHYFDGLAMIQKFEIKDGKVAFRCQFVKSETYKRNMAANRIVVTEFGTVAFPDPCKSLFQRYFTYFTSSGIATDNTSVNVFPMGDELYLATEVPLLNRIDQTTLDVKEQHDLRKLVSVFTATAHPHIDPDGTVHNVGMGKGDKGPAYLIVRFDPQEKGEEAVINTARQVASVNSRWALSPGYMHSFGMTQNYYIILEAPLVMNVLKLKALSFFHMPFNKAITWHEGFPTFLHVVSKETGECQTFEADPFFAFHQVNAFEDDGHVVVDLSCYRSGAIINKVSLENMAKDEDVAAGNPSLVKRFVLPLKPEPEAEDPNLVKLGYTKATAHFISRDGKDKKVVHCSPEQLCRLPVEFPAINYRAYNTKKYRYFYGVNFSDEENKGPERLVKCDLETRETLVWEEEGGYPSEPVFVAAPNAEEEDDGVLLSIVISHNEDRQRYQSLLILDAKSMTEMARAELPQVSIPRTFHGNFMPDWF